MKKFDSTFDHNLLQSLFNEIKNEGNYIYTNDLIKHFNVFKKENFRNVNNDTFKENFISHFKSVTSFSELKNLFEKIDSQNNGLLSKIDFCNALRNKTKEYHDEDIMKFIRICSLFQDNKIKYTDFLNLIYYNPKEDQFNQIMEALKTEFEKNNKDVNQFFAKILNEKYNPIAGNVFLKEKEMAVNKNNAKAISIEKMYEYLKPAIANLNKNLICKLDLDLDGKISIDDMRAILERYSNTSFFKFENNENSTEINLYPHDSMSEQKFKQIVKDIKAALRMKNLTEIGLFNKLDTNKDGFVSHSEFNNNIEEVIKLAPGIKDKFFLYLDVMSLGMVDLETFLKRFKEFTSKEIIVKNNWDVENLILKELGKWVQKNTKLTENEIFSVLDFDSDGVINLNDFKKFVLDKLNFSKNDANDIKLERIVHHISLTKNKNLGMADLHEFINNSRKNKIEDILLKDSIKFTTLTNLKKDDEWVLGGLEKLGLYVSENYDSLEKFFEENSVLTTGKMRLEEFKNFIHKHHTCFSDMNLSTDEILTLYSAIDSQKKTYVTLEDIKNKLSVYDFYKKMHLDIRNFIRENFVDGVDAFKFLSQKSENTASTNLVKKEIFDGISNLFPGKYVTNTILRYLSKYFKDCNNIPFSEFNYVYFDTVRKDESLKMSHPLKNRLKTARGERMATHIDEEKEKAFSENVTNRNWTSRAKSATVFGRNSTKVPIVTPFDDDPLEKIKRTIYASPFDFSTFFKMYELVSEKGMMNHNEFRNMIKKLNLGLTTLEIDKVIARVGKSSDNKINLKDFVNFIKNQDSNIAQAKQNVAPFIAQLKQLIYKYYTNAKFAFQFNDKNSTQEMDFNKFKNVVYSLFEKDTKPNPNFALIKSAYEFIDLRKDGIIDMNEWNRAFSMAESNLDVKNVANPQILNQLKDWENSKDISDIHLLITRNKKIIKEEAKDLLIKQGQFMNIHANNLIAILKAVLTGVSMSCSQWKILVSIADREKNNFIDFDLFIKLVSASSKITSSHPKIK